jgi:hypothetical protein
VTQRKSAITGSSFFAYSTSIIMRDQLERIIVMGREYVLTTRRGGEETPTERVDDKVFEDRVARTHTAVKDIVKTIFGGVFIFVVLDTVRQVLIARNTDIQVFD